MESLQIQVQIRPFECVGTRGFCRCRQLGRVWHWRRWRRVDKNHTSKDNARRNYQSWERRKTKLLLQPCRCGGTANRKQRYGCDICHKRWYDREVAHKDCNCWAVNNRRDRLLRSRCQHGSPFHVCRYRFWSTVNGHIMDCVRGEVGTLVRPYWVHIHCVW